jgi:succinate dehydrogenase/fumarate reductase-like Fe-S protein
MEDRLTNLKDHLSTSKSTKHEAPTEIIIPTENKMNVSKNVKVDIEENSESIQEIRDETIQNNTKNEIKETLDSITTIIEEKQDV